MQLCLWYMPYYISKEALQMFQHLQAGSPQKNKTFNLEVCIHLLYSATCGRSNYLFYHINAESILRGFNLNTLNVRSLLAGQVTIYFRRGSASQTDQRHGTPDIQAGVWKIKPWPI